MTLIERKPQIVEACKARLNDSLAVIQEDLRRLRDAAAHNADENMSESYDSNQQEMLNDISDLESHLNFLEESAALFNRIDFSNGHETVQPGAVVLTDRLQFLVGVSGEFESDGEKFQGISASAPIYAEMKGKQAGDTFSMNDIKYKIKEVY
ncbi:hypothetical protein GCM10027275_05260 [Rhabdobacter roseus]|uniref:Transcription elongation GreA/GreB family factor n=1 Tax=Rhabdobacter roseus TaxID=1655419 RepID=A0A840TKT8_9BACT|nr:hypothetical protein [Rhabdobacter roseus]MBB5282417.1 transcription elongation GreA/GreB family factor [Rhabdobacter roseus]